LIHLLLELQSSKSNRTLVTVCDGLVDYRYTNLSSTYNPERAP